ERAAWPGCAPRTRYWRWPMTDVDAGIRKVMAAVRGVKVHPGTDGAVGEELERLLEAAAGAGAPPAVLGYLQEGEAAFHAGDLDGTVKHLSRALLQVTMVAPRTRTSREGV